MSEYKLCFVTVCVHQWFECVRNVGAVLRLKCKSENWRYCEMSGLFLVGCVMIVFY